MFCRQCGAQLTDNATFCMQCGAKVNDAPQQAMQETPVTYQMPYEPMYNPEETPPKKPINKKKLALSLVSILLCLSLVAGLFVYFTYYATAERAVKEAAEDSAELLEDLLTEDTGLERLLEAIDDLDGEFTLSLSSDTGSASLAFSDKKEIIALMFDMEPMSYHLMADNEKLVLFYPSFLDKAYSIPLANMGEELLSSTWLDGVPDEYRNMMRGIDIRLFDIPSYKTIEEQEFYAKFNERLQIEEVDAVIPHSKGVDTVYSMHMDMDDYANYSMECMKYMLEPMLGSQLSAMMALSMGTTALSGAELNILYGLDEDDRLVAIHAVGTGTQDIGEFTIVLTGNRNPWEQIELYADGEQVSTISIQKENGVISVYVDGGRFLLIDDQRLILGHEEDPRTIYYEVRNGGCYFTLEIDGQTVELELLPTCHAEMPPGKITSLLTLSDDELYALMEQVDAMFR